jgi:hypothetical protein
VTINLLMLPLRAYQAGARATRRACEARCTLSDEVLGARAAEAREQARADDRSARLLLGQIHELRTLGIMTLPPTVQPPGLNVLYRVMDQTRKRLVEALGVRPAA